MFIPCLVTLSTVLIVIQDLQGLEEERKQLRAALDDSEARNTKLELLKRSLEGDIQRTKVLLTDKETECQVLQERIDGITKVVQDLEGKNQSLQLTVDRLSLSLGKAEEEESAQKVRTHHNWTYTIHYV